MADSATVLGLLEYYINLLIIQYNNQPKARATISANTTQLLANGIFWDVIDGYYVDTAIGRQLDVIGKYVGVDRFYNSDDINSVAFGYSDQYENEPANVTGYADTSDFLSKDGTFLSIFDLIGNGYQLSDDDFRVLIKLKILLNHSNFSDKKIDDDLEASFAGVLYAVDNYNMSMDYFTDANLSLIVTVALAKGLLPAPMGVRINHLIEENVYFGFSNYRELEGEGIEGYASTADFLTKDGTYLGVENLII